MKINLTQEEVINILLAGVRNKYNYAFKYGSGLDYDQAYSITWNGLILNGNDDGTSSFFVDKFEPKKEKK